MKSSLRIFAIVLAVFLLSVVSGSGQTKRTQTKNAQSQSRDDKHTSASGKLSVTGSHAGLVGILNIKTDSTLQGWLLIAVVNQDQAIVKQSGDELIALELKRTNDYSQEIRLAPGRNSITVKNTPDPSSSLGSAADMVRFDWVAVDTKSAGPTKPDAAKPLLAGALASPSGKLAIIGLHDEEKAMIRGIVDSSLNGPFKLLLLDDAGNALKDADGKPIVKEIELKRNQTTFDESVPLAKGKNVIKIVSTDSAEVAEVVVLPTWTVKGATTAARGEDPAANITIKGPAKDYVVSSGTVDANLSVKKDSGIKKIQVEVINAGKKIAQPNVEPIPVNYVDDKPGTINPTVTIGKGENTILFFDAENPSNPKSQAFVKVTCADKCDTPPEASGKITIKQPGKDSIFEDKQSIDSRIIVQKSSEIKNLRIRVTNDGHDVDQPYLSGKPIPLTFEGENTTAEVFPQLRVTKGNNIITVFDASNAANQTSVSVSCRGNRCGFLDSAGSQNYRAIVGFEQAGASSASSQTKPFLDFFFNSPLRFGGTITPADLEGGPLEEAKDYLARKDRLRVPNPLPLVSAWGQIRLSTTPEQTGAVGVFPSNLIDRVTQVGSVVDLVQSFDFLAGLEYRLFGTNGQYLSLGNGPRRAQFYLVGGGGAISPLSSKRESVEIFSVPALGSPQRDLFISRFGTEAASKQFIAFVLPERDRFLRQFYAGLRIKTFECANPGCTQFQNNFPAVLDVMLGKNEAVTGGKFSNDETDSTGKIIGQRDSYVLRFDGFFPLPIRGSSFFIFGTAMMKVFSGGPKITTPLFMDRAEGTILVTNPNVFVAPNLQLDRDYYKIGVGFDLMNLFRRGN